jgi:pimeloyl-ACP methyl ester carboxylesterase
VNEVIEIFVTVEDRQLYVRDHPGSAPTIVALHGFPDDSRIYNRLIPALAPFRVVTFDWGGYGRSSRRDGTQFSPTDRKREMLAVLDQLGLDHVVLVGHDSSGPEVINFAVAHSERVAQVVLLNTYNGRSQQFRLPEMIALIADPALAPLADALLDDPDHRLWLLAYTARRFGLDDAQAPDGIAVTSIIPQFFGDTEQPDALAEIRAWTADIASALDRQDAAIASGRLHGVTLPVSVIFGRNDPNLNPGVAQHISGLFANTQLHLLDHASHWPQWDRPEPVAELIKTIAAPR